MAWSSRILHFQEKREIKQKRQKCDRNLLEEFYLQARSRPQGRKPCGAEYCSAFFETK